MNFEVRVDRDLERDEVVPYIEDVIFGRTGVVRDWDNVRPYAKGETIFVNVSRDALKQPIEDMRERVGDAIEGVNDKISQEHYVALRGIVPKLTPEQWRDFGTFSRGSTANLNGLGDKVDAYLQRVADREADARIRGHAAEALSEPVRIVREADPLPDIAPGRPAGVFEPMRFVAFDTALKRAGYEGGFLQFQASSRVYLDAFEREVVRQGLEILARYELLLAREADRYRRPEQVAELYAALRPLRDMFPATRQAMRQYNEWLREPDQTKPRDGANDATLVAAKTPPTEIILARLRSDAGIASGAALMQCLADRFPILAEDHLPLARRLDKTRLATADNKALTAMLAEHIAARTADVARARSDLTKDPGRVYRLDKLMFVAKSAMGITPGSTEDWLIERERSRREAADEVTALLEAIFVLALSLLSAGSGTVAMVARGALAGASIGSTVDAVTDYGATRGAYGAGLSSEAPSVASVVVAAIGATIDVGAVAGIGRLATTAAEIDELGKAAKSGAANEHLEKLAKLKGTVATSTAKAAVSRQASSAAFDALRRALMSKAYSLPGPLFEPGIWKQLVSLAYHRMRAGIYELEAFIAEVRAAKVGAQLAATLSPEEVARLERALEQGAKFADDAELERYLDLTHPTLEPDPNAVVRGKPERFSADMGEVQKRVIRRQKQIGEDLRRAYGFDVELLRPLPGRARRADFKIDGEFVEVYSPQANTPLKGIWKKLETDKLGQADRFVLDLSDWNGDRIALEETFQSRRMEGLKEAFVYEKDRTVRRIYPPSEGP